MESLDKRLNLAVDLLKSAKRVIAFTGAGISTESGISDFRSPGGIWDRYRMITYQEFLASHDARVEYWKMKSELIREMKGARPNNAHMALAELEKMGRLKCLITQNIDGLHQEAGNSPENVIELHGTNRKAVCIQCGKVWPIEEMQKRLEAGDRDPQCDDCKGFIKPATISFGQAMPVEEMKRAAACAEDCDLFFMIGSSLQVEPAASIPPVAHRAGADLIFINRTSTHWDNIAGILFRENAGDVMKEIVNRFKESL
ncbi:MAG: SIR2 family NAD-dependent protein deacylase [bacterium]